MCDDLVLGVHVWEILFVSWQKIPIALKFAPRFGDLSADARYQQSIRFSTMH